MKGNSTSRASIINIFLIIKKLAKASIKEIKQEVCIIIYTIMFVKAIFKN